MQRTVKVLLTMVLALTLVASLASIAQANDYSSHWSAQFIDDAASRGWMTGDGSGNYRPEAAITRGEFAVMLWRALNKPNPVYTCPFNDVPSSAFYYQAVTALFEAKVVNGLNSTTFAPNISLTREMGFTMLARAYNFNANDANAYQWFADFREVSEWARAAVSALVEKGYISGVGDNRAAPRQQLKRGEMAKLLITVSDGHKAALTAAQQSAISAITAYTSGPTITIKQTPMGSDEVFVTVTATDSWDVTFVGWRTSEKDAKYTSKSGFTDITNSKDFSVISNGWYAVYAENKNGYGSFKLFEVTTIKEDVPKVRLTQRNISNSQVEITITVTRAPSGADIDYIGYRTAKEGDTFSSKSGFDDRYISSNKFTVDSAKDYGWYAVCAVDKNGRFGYRLIEVKKSGTIYTVTFNANGGTGAPASITVAHGNSISEPSAKPTRNGYEFAGWHTHQTNSSPFNYNSQITRNITLYARWVQQGVIEAVFHLNYPNEAGDSYAVLETQSVKKGEKIIKPPDPTRSNYTFEDWFNVRGFEFNFNEPVDGTSSIIIIYASWFCTLTYDKNTTDTVTEMPSSSNKYEGELFEISNSVPRRNGYIFEGWAESSSGPVKYQVNESFEATRNITLYAIWTRETAPSITTASLLNGTVNTAYSQTLAATGSDPIWDITAGSLPAGLNLSNGGIISGTPTAAGTFTFTVRARNNAGNSTKELSITIVQTYRVTLTVGSEGGGTVSGGGDNIVAGSRITVTATPNEGYVFDGWYQNNELIAGATTAYEVTVNANITLEARFKPTDISPPPAPTYTITVIPVPPAGGTVRGEGDYCEGESVSVEALTNGDYTFLGWFENGDRLTMNPIYAFTVMADRILEARFQLSGGTGAGGGSIFGIEE